MDGFFIPQTTEDMSEYINRVRAQAFPPSSREPTRRDGLNPVHTEEKECCERVGSPDSRYKIFRLALVSFPPLMILGKGSFRQDFS
jgi:hypothetical protein